MKKILLPLLFMMLTGHSFAAVSPQAESQIRAMLPNTRITQINQAPFPGMYEVLAGDNAFYVNPDNESEIIVGHILNTKSMQDETDLRIAAERNKRYNFNKLPLNQAIKVGNGKKQIAVFVDPDCPYCQQLELYLSKNLSKLTIYYFFIPLPMHPMAKEHIEQILCATSPSKAIDTIMVKKLSATTPDKSCLTKADNQIAQIQKYSTENGINATPFIITDSNTVIGGFDTNALDNYLGVK